MSNSPKMIKIRALLANEKGGLSIPLDLSLPATTTLGGLRDAAGHEIYTVAPQHAHRRILGLGYEVRANA